MNRKIRWEWRQYICEFLVICFFSLVAGFLRTYSAFLLARLKVWPKRFLIDNVALQASVNANLVSRVLRTVGTVSDWWLLCAKIQPIRVCFVTSSVWIVFFWCGISNVSRLRGDWACEEKCLCIYSTVAYFHFSNVWSTETNCGYLGFVF